MTFSKRIEKKKKKSLLPEAIANIGTIQQQVWEIAEPEQMSVTVMHQKKKRKTVKTGK